MILKWIFDRVISLLGLLILWPVLLVVAILVKVKMPGGPAFFVQKRVGRGGKLFKCHKFRTMTMKHSGSSVSVAGDSRITPLGARTCSSATRLISAGKKFSCNLKRTGSYPYEREAEQHVARPGVEQSDSGSYRCFGCIMRPEV